MPNSSQTQVCVHFVCMFVFNLANVFVFKSTAQRQWIFFVTHMVEIRRRSLQRKNIGIMS